MAHSLTFFCLFFIALFTVPGQWDYCRGGKKNKKNFCLRPEKNLRLNDVRRCRVDALPPPRELPGTKRRRRRPWRAGGGLQVASWAQPSAYPLGGGGGGGRGSSMFMVGAYERICCSIHHCQGRLSSAEKKQKQHLRYPPPQPAERPNTGGTWICGGMTYGSGREFFCVMRFWSEPCFHHASPSPFVTGWEGGLGRRARDGDRWGGREGGRRKKPAVPATETVCRCGLGAYANGWRTRQTSHRTWRTTGRFFSCRPAVRSWGEYFFLFYK